LVGPITRELVSGSGTAACEDRKALLGPDTPRGPLFEPADAHQILYGSAPVFVAAKARLELRPQQIFDLLAARCDTTDEELELIEMRYQQALALVNLQALFAEGYLDST